MKLFLFFLLFVGFQDFQDDVVPYKPDDEFQVNIDLAFKIKESKYGISTYNQNGERMDRVSSTPLPFLNVSVTQFKVQGDEVKVLAVDSKDKTLTKKNVSSDLVLHFDMGFVDDLKKGAANNQIIIYFLSQEKKKLRKITFSVTATGAFEVNGKWHGQF
jgi:hypothetical protein